MHKLVGNRVFARAIIPRSRPGFVPIAAVRFRRATCMECEHVDEYMGRAYCGYGRTGPPCSACLIDGLIRRPKASCKMPDPKWGPV